MRDGFARACMLLTCMLVIGCSRRTPPPQTPAADSARSAEVAGAPSDSSAAKTIALSYEQRQGKVLYGKYCTICHGAEGKGDGFNSFNLDPKPRDFTDAKYMSALSDERIQETIRAGGRGVNRSPLMPSWGGRMTRVEIQYVVAYLRTFSTAQ